LMSAHLGLDAHVDHFEGLLRDKLARDTGFADAATQAYHLHLQFRKFDTDGSGAIEFDEFEKTMIHVFNFVGSQEVLMALFERYDVDGSGSLSYKEFIEQVVGLKVNPFGDAETRSVLERLRRAVAKRGGMNGIRSMARVFRNMDDNGSKLLDFDELRVGVRELGVDLSDKDHSTLCNILDRSGDALVSFDEFLRAMRGKMNKRRVDLVRQAFDQFDRTGDGVVTVDDLKGTYDVSRLPDVRSGKISEDEALEDFLNQFDGGDKDGVIHFDEFLDYYRDISASVDSDDEFELIVRNAWHIAGGEGAAANTSNIRVLVVHRDGRQTVETVEHDLGISRSDLRRIREQLEDQGIHDIARIELAH